MTITGLDVTAAHLAALAVIRQRIEESVKKKTDMVERINKAADAEDEKTRTAEAEAMAELGLTPANPA